MHSKVLLRECQILISQNEYFQAWEALFNTAETIEHLRLEGNPRFWHELAIACRHASTLLFLEGSFEEAFSFASTTYRLAAEADDPEGCAIACHRLAMIWLALGDFERARSCMLWASNYLKEACPYSRWWSVVIHNGLAHIESQRMVINLTLEPDLIPDWENKVGSSLTNARRIIEAVEKEEVGFEFGRGRMSPLKCEADLIEARRLMIYGLNDATGGTAWTSAFGMAMEHGDKYTCAQLLHILAKAIYISRETVPTGPFDSIQVPIQWTLKTIQHGYADLPSGGDVDWVYQAIWCCKKAANILLNLGFLEAQRPILELLREIGGYRTFPRCSIREALNEGFDKAIESGIDLADAMSSPSLLKDHAIEIVENTIRQLFQKQLASLEASLKLIHLNAEVEGPVNGSDCSEGRESEMLRLEKIRDELALAADEIRDWFKSNKWPEEGLPVRPRLHKVFIAKKRKTLDALLSSIKAVPYASYYIGKE